MGYNRFWLQLCVTLYFVCFASATTAMERIVSLSHKAELFVCEVDGAIGRESTTPILKQCKPSDVDEIDPQGKDVWIKMIFDFDRHKMAINEPLGLYLFAKASSRTFLNDVEIGNNGSPAKEASNESAGQMDWVGYLPIEMMREKNNQLLIHLSSHQGVLKLHRPLHFIGLATYGDPKRFIQTRANLSIALMGALMIGGFYFFALSFNRFQRSNAVPLSAMSLITSLQLFAEISRGIIGYEYPIHDLRLIIITILSFCFGTLLLFLVTRKFSGESRWHWFYAGLIATSLTVYFLPGFDLKTTSAIFIPSLVAIICLTYLFFKRKDKSTIKYILVLSLFVVGILISSASFHELVVYLITTILMSFLFIQQAIDFSKEQTKRRAEEKQVAKLEYLLAQREQQSKPEFLNISSAGSVEKISIDVITFCKASGDYAELYCENKVVKLYSGSLKKLEESLPKTFLRVHRSYLVNLDKVSSLKSEASSGNLILNDGSEIPVSRRLLPEVRTAVKR